MPTLKYRDPADGLWKYVDGVSQGHPMAMITSSAAQTLTTAVVTAAAMDTVVYDTGGMTDGVWSLGSQRLIAPLSGYYRHYAHSGFNLSTGGYRAVVVRKNGTTAVANGALVGHTYGPPSAGQITAITQTSEPQWFNAGEYITLNLMQTSGADLITTLGNSRYPSLALEYVGLVGAGATTGSNVTTLQATQDVIVAGLSLPRGQIGYTELTANPVVTSASSTMVDPAGLAATVTLATARRLKVTIQAHLQSTVASDRYGFAIREGSTLIFSGTFLGANVVNIPVAQTYVANIAATAGTHTYKASFSRPGGTGTVTMIASATSPANISVEDIGT